MSELSAIHLEMLHASAISDAVIAARGYETVTKAADLERLGFSKNQRRIPSFVLPVHGVHGGVVRCQIRPDVPRVVNGKAIKYETPKDTKMVLDVHPSVRHLLADPEIPLFVTEGIKKGDAIVSHGSCAIALLGVWNWRGTNEHGGKTALADWESIALNGRRVYVVFDSDIAAKTTVRSALSRLSEFLKSRGADVGVINLPAGPQGEKVGVDDYIAAGHSVDDLCSLASPELRTVAEDAPPAVQRTAADRLIDYALASGAEFFHDERDDPHVAVEIDGRRQVRSLSSQDVKRWLALVNWQHEHRAISGETIASALMALGALAVFEGDQHPLFVRVARVGEDIWYDLGDWRAVRIHADGWGVVERPPLLFRHFRHQKPQVEPRRGGRLHDFLQLLNIRDERHQTLALVYLVSSLVPNIPRPVVAVHGEHGSGKSTFFSYLRSLLDPSLLRPQAAPDSLREFVQAASHNLCLFLDNVSFLPDWLSDALCRYCTGDGFSKRVLYTDDDDVIYDLRGLGGINGINIMATRADLLDRSLIFTLGQLDDTERMTEEASLARFEELKPYLLGAMFDTLSAAMRTVQDVNMPVLPRMADFAKWGCAIAEHLEYSPAEFMDALGLNTAAQNETAIENSAVAQAILKLMEEVERWEDSPTATLQRLAEVAGRGQIDTKARAWPKTPSHLTRRLNEVAPNLARLGIRLSRPRSGNERLIVLQRTGTAVIAVIEPETAVIGADVAVTPTEAAVTYATGEKQLVASGTTIGDGNDGNAGNRAEWVVP